MVSKPARPARPAIWWNSRARSTRCLRPSYFVSEVSSTVRIGTLMPTPRVSVPQMTASSPAWARVSTSRRYFGSIPAWCTPTPCSTSRRRVTPNPLPKRKPPTASLMAALRALDTSSTLVSAWACSTADAWVNDTT